MKRLARLYPRRWRERYGTEIDAFLERRTFTSHAVVDLLRGIVDAHLHPELARELVFVPEIGFRPSGTRALLETSRTHQDDTTITVRSVAAAPDRTELVIEWESQTGAAAACEPRGSPSQPPAIDERAAKASAIGSVPPNGILVASATARGADEVVFAKLHVRGAHPVDALNFGPRAFLSRHGWSTHAITFPPLPPGADQAELVLGVDGKEWRVPLALTRSRLGAIPVAVETRHDGLVVRVTAVGRSGDEVMVGLEVEGEDPSTLIGQIGSEPPPLMPPMLKAPRNWEPAQSALLLTDDRGDLATERRRVRHAKTMPTGMRGPQPPRRFTSLFWPVHPDAKSAVVSVPLIEISEIAGSAEVDLSALPATVELNGHGFEIARAEASTFGPDYRKIVIRPLDAGERRRAVRPLSVRARIPAASGYSYSWGGEPDGMQWMDTLVEDPPVVVFHGATVEVRGPWELHVPLD